jgi:endonuclease/exonuclease/phosphatase family metal-dependent hydrolase
MKLRVLTYNIRSCHGISGIISPEAVAFTIAATGADIAGLQEVDFFNPRSGFTDQPRKIGKMLGMHAVFGPNVTRFLFIRFGNTVLSRYPVESSQNFPLPSTGEKRGLLRVRISLGHRAISFFTTHLGLNQSERMLQVREIMNIINSESEPLILTGDFNASPEAPEIKKIQATLLSVDPAGAWSTFPSTLPRHKIDYIFFSSHWRLRESKLYESLASDHLPLLGLLELAGDR